MLAIAASNSEIGDSAPFGRIFGREHEPRDR
jgi:hypothetical protein